MENSTLLSALGWLCLDVRFAHTNNDPMADIGKWSQRAKRDVLAPTIFPQTLQFIAPCQTLDFGTELQNLSRLGRV